MDRQTEQIEEPKIKVEENCLAVGAALFFFSYFGVLVREGLNHWNTYAGQPVSAIIYSQFVGCLIMGCVLENKVKIESKAHSWYIGLTTGLCGSITTFSGIILDASSEFFNVIDNPRGVFYDITAGIAIYLIGLGMAFVGFDIGRHFGRWIATELYKKPVGQLTYLGSNLLKFGAITKFDIPLIILGLGSMSATLAIVLSVKVTRSIIWAVVFAPAGTFLRRWLSFLNPKTPKFPVGTFIANIFGSGVIAVFYLLPGVADLNDTECSILSGLMDGFCGCLTTISTFVVEYTFLKGRYRYLYALASIIFAQLLQIILFICIDYPTPYKNLCT